MFSAVRQDLQTFRNDPAVLFMAFEGLNLTGANMGLRIVDYPDYPGTARAALATTTTPGAEGLRLVEVTYDADGVPTSFVEGIVLKATQQAMPAAPEIGGDAELYYDLQVTLATDTSDIWGEYEGTLWFGTWRVKGSANL